MEGVRIVFLVSNIRNNPKLLCIQATKAVCQTFRRCGVDREMVTILVRPLFHTTFHIANNIQCKFLGFRIAFPAVSKEDCSHFVQTDVAQRNCRTTILKELINALVFSKTASEGPVLIENRGVCWCCFLGPFNTVNQSIFCDVYTLIEDFPKLIQIPFRFEGDTRQIDCHNT